MELLKTLTLLIITAPLLGAAAAGLFCRYVSRPFAHRLTITLMGISFLLSVYVAYLVMHNNLEYNGALYIWGQSGNLTLNVGFLIDHLTACMMVTVTFVSFLVHIYSIGYMEEDGGYQRFFAYISLFTFFMLMLITGNNFLQLFFGWEGVGLASYLLIGFWFHRDSANEGSLKAFLVNRVGDFGFVVGIAGVLNYFGSLDYAAVFAAVPNVAALAPTLPGTHWSAISAIGFFLFIGAMAKSAQMPLHVWLPESMEGPTPISALIHAATMVTAGVFMVARLSPLYQYTPSMQSFILIIGATGALFTGLIAIVQNDIKRVVAYSTLSQLGYMMAAAGVSAYAASIFHLMTHAAFKALLFLGAGSVIIAMHHDQDLRHMGGLRKHMPITYITFLIGTLALCAIPPFSGFYSKDAIIEAVKYSQISGASYAYVCVVLGSFVTAFYSFRALFLAFHGEERMDDHTKHHLKESPWVVWLPLVLLAIPSVFQGYLMIKPMLFSSNALLGNSITVLPQNNVLATMTEEFHGSFSMILTAFNGLPLWFALLGAFFAWYAYMKRPGFPTLCAQRFKVLYTILIHKYGFDDFNDLIFVRGGQATAKLMYKGDSKIIDDFFVNGAGRVIEWFSSTSRRMQTGYIYHYAFVMVLGLIVLLGWLMF
ncbi:MAG: proton-translocating NADH-quinone oxidoreductase, chain [Gammaproteobacteria bacterium]|jgi:NADH-quinone oxidoreductase subunit L|nr:proton-translocating NADH-quinone oxidoreductase, chain [Gammaproteobacteria bacterium]